MGSKSRPISTGSKSKNNNDWEGASSSPINKECVICASEGSTKIVRDANFDKVMLFFLQGILVDVKPFEYLKFGVCADCFEILVEFYDTNDVLVELEKHLKKIRIQLLAKTLGGIKKLESDGNPQLPFHMKFCDKWGKEKFENNGNEEVGDGSSLSTYLLDDTNSSRKGKNLNDSVNSAERTKKMQINVNSECAEI